MDKICDRKYLAVVAGMKNRMTTQNREKWNANKIKICDYSIGEFVMLSTAEPFCLTGIMSVSCEWW